MQQACKDQPPQFKLNLPSDFPVFPGGLDPTRTQVTMMARVCAARTVPTWSCYASRCTPRDALSSTRTASWAAATLNTWITPRSLGLPERTLCIWQRWKTVSKRPKNPPPPISIPLGLTRRDFVPRVTLENHK